MANDLVTRLLLNSTQFENNLGKSAKQVQNFQQRAQQVSQVAGIAFTAISTVVGKIAPAVGGAVTAMEAFNKTIEHSQTLTDEFGRITRSTTSSVDAFFSSLANGDFSNFINGLNQVIVNAREAYDAIDALGTFNIFRSPQIAEIEKDISKYKYKIKAGIDVEVNKKKLKEAEYKLQKVTKQSIEKNRTAYYATMRQYLGEQGGKYSNEQIDKVFGSYDSFSDYEKKYRDFSKKRAKINEEIRKGTTDSEGVLHYDRNATKAKQKLQDLEKENRNLIALHEIGDDKLKDAFQYRTAMFNEEGKYYNQLISNLKTLNKQITATGRNTKNVVEEVQRLTNDKFDFSVSQIKLFNNNTNSFEGFSDEIVNQLKTLPVEIKDELERDFTRIVNQQKSLDQSFRDGIISEEQYISEGSQLSENIYSTVSKFMHGDFINHSVTAENQSKVTQLLGNLLEISKHNIISNRANAKVRGDAIALNKKNAELKKGANNLDLDYFSARGKSELETVANSAVELEMAIIETKQEWKKLLESEGISNTMRTYINNSMKDLAKYQKMVNNVRENAYDMVNQFQKLEDLSDISNSIASVGNSVANVFRAAGDEMTAFALQSIAQLTELIAQLANMAIVAGVTSAAKLPFPYNLAAITTTIATITSVLAGAMQTFATGGIVDGNSYVGDRKLVRVNSGEMILNKRQQANLFNLINDGRQETTVGGGNVTFRIQGKELVGVLNNYNNRRSKLL